MGMENGSEIDDAEFRIFVGGLSWSTEEDALLDAFQPYGALNAKIVMNRDTGRSRGFGFVSFPDKKSTDDAIDEMHNRELDGRSITVSLARNERSFGGGGRGGRGSFGGDRGGGGGGECFKCGRDGHWARDCPDGGGGYGDRRGGDRAGRGGYGGDRRSGGRGSYGDRDSDRYHGGGGGGSDRYSDRYGDDLGSGGRSYGGRDRPRAAPYDRPPKDGGFRD